MRKWGITKRALFLGLAPASAIATVLAWYFTFNRFGELDLALAERGQAIARQLAPAAEYGVFSGNHEILHKLAQSALLEADLTAVTISDAEGRVLAQSGAPRNPRLKSPVFKAPIVQTQTELEEFLQTPPVAKKILGYVVIEVSRASLIKKKNELLMDTVLITALALFLTSLVAIRISRDITHPILKLSDTVDRFAQGELSLRADTDAGGALGILQAGVNKMAAALQSAQTGLEERIRVATAQLSEKKAEADRANLAKSRFLAAASHDLRQPVHALGLFVAELQTKNVSAPDAKIVAGVEAGVLALSDMLDSMLDISRLEAGVLPAHVVDFCVAGILDRMAAEFEGEARVKGLRFTIVPSNAIVRSDPVLLERIVLNLVANAVRYTNTGRIVLGCRRRNGQLSIQVWDTGIGIPESRRQYIFQEFYQLGNPERDRRKGLGLGLAIVEGLANLLGHKIELASTCGRGSMFAVDVPFGDPAAVSEAPQAYAAPSGLEHAFLAIIDDDDLVREGMQGLIAQWGCEAVFAASGDQLLRELDGRIPDVLICDYRLPRGESGIEVISCVRAACGKSIPALLISGDTSPKLVRAAESAGYPLLHKPVRPAKLRALVTHLLTKQEA
jgi:signal transduction histidine kinase/CheY-like chemotaxis protein